MRSIDGHAMKRTTSMTTQGKSDQGSTKTDKNRQNNASNVKNEQVDTAVLTALIRSLSPQTRKELARDPSMKMLRTILESPKPETKLDSTAANAEKAQEAVTIPKEEYDRLRREEEAARFWERVYKRLDALQAPTPMDRASVLGSEIMNVPSSELEKLLEMLDKEHDKTIAEIKERVKAAHDAYASSMEKAERALAGA